MRFTSLVLAAIAATTASAADPGYAVVNNKCPFNVYVWSVGGGVGPKNTVGQGGQYSERIHRDPVSGGVALKATTVDDGLYKGSAQTIFAYNLDGNTVWYDLSDIMGDAFKGHKVVVKTTDPQCPTIEWADGVPPAGSQVRSCHADANVYLELCA